MKIHQADLQISAVSPQQYPPAILSEIAFVGRSNVGKSSLVNSLLGRKKLARISSQPGKTQTLNFYLIDQKFRFVDVPGYGYAKVSQQKRQDWGKMIETYLTQRDNLRGVISLIDGRHAPTQLDQQMVDYLKYYQLPLLIVATKTDKIAKGRRQQIKATFKRQLQLGDQDQVVLFSIVEHYGQAEVWQWITEKIS
ncbi:ribosome biogenesis GTP-binding protein YihA/YsxC [Liquorilactobacillus vini]|uniref:Probable GTP-binding protein EngB n=2 Tax=Liquorilactobacillus vini TaxID=238015 RepID=A0A0R2CDH1_9LACO|nr:ribosome biogenesis GTP-binding protein YihA/YsxC [Liquorilactobacillus vini]KRM89793.1 GTP-binding protein [Liquorilactobacillus vini DSM 20605]